MPKEFTMCQTKVVEIYETIFKLRDFSYEIFTNMLLLKNPQFLPNNYGT